MNFKTTRGVMNEKFGSLVMRIVIKNLPESTTKQEIEEHFNQKGTVMDVFMLENGDGVFRRTCFVGFNTEQEALDSKRYYHNTYFKNHRVSVEMAKHEDRGGEKSDTQLRKALYSKTIVIKHLGGEATEECLLEALERIGKVVDVKLEKRNGTQVSIVRFREGESAEKALKTVRIIAGKRVKVGNFRENVIDARKEHYSSLFFNFDTVVKRVCEMEKVAKQDLVDLQDKDLGPRIAMLETSLVDQTKKFLECNNIFLDGMQQEKHGSMVVLRSADLLGALDLIKGEFKVNIAPSGCLALLDFKNPKEAEQCCRDMNMRRFKNQVVYCEFAPICKAPSLPVDTPKESSTAKKGSSNKIIVKNIPFQATSEELKKLFSSYVCVSEVRLPKKPDGTHRGFGFIVLDSADNVDKAIEYFGSSTHLYGRRLVLERAKQ